MKKNNVIIFEDNPLYIKKLVKDKPLNLFGTYSYRYNIRIEY